MDKIKRFIDCGIATLTCNLRCHYCYITQNRQFDSKLVQFQYPPETIAKALSKERLGGPCLFNLCAGGETLLSPDILPVTRALIEEGHYVMIVTNGTLTKRFEEVATWPRNILDHLFFKFSFHFLELERLGWMDRFFANVQLMKQVGASFTVEITPSDELIPRIEDVKSICMERLGALCHVTIARDERTSGFEVLSEHDFDTYKQIWGQFDSELFRFKADIFSKKRNEFCYAGDWSAFLFLDTGDLKQCNCGRVIDNIYAHMDRPIRFEAIGHQCTMPHCFNGHAFLTLGVIPEFSAPTFDQMRNRVCEDGSQWLSSAMKSFFMSKLRESNREYSTAKKSVVALNQRLYHLKEKSKRIKPKLKRLKQKIFK